jgi:Xanthine and CO dehydrogenases maturation factor, XdhC/CoxF family
MDLSLMEKIVDSVKAGRRGVLCILIEQSGSTPRKEGASMWVHPDGSIEGTIGGGPMEHECIQIALDMLEKGETVRVQDCNLGAGLHPGACPESAVCGGESRVYFEAVAPEDEIFVFGAGHVGKALARLAAASGFRVTVWDERAEYANEENIPWARPLACPLAEVFDAEKHPGLLHGGSYVVIVTRGHNLDSDAMRLMEGRKVAYIGVIGSRGKIAFVDKKLTAMGVSQAFLDSMRRPVGLPIRAETPEEIAVCILAEIIAVKRGANVEALRSAK